MKLASLNVTEIFEKLKSVPSESLESETLEFKNYQSESALHNAKDLAEEISALANKRGGAIIVGVIDSSNVKSYNWQTQLNGFEEVDLDTTKERLLGKINPKLNLNLRNVLYEDKSFLIIEVPRSFTSIVSTSSGKTCIREGKSSRAAFPAEIEQLVKSLTIYDWSAEELDLNPYELLNESALQESKEDFCKRRKLEINIDNSNFLEAIGATKNGVLNKGGLLFLGKTDAIKKYLGNYEYRFSWKTKTGDLKANDVWEDCIWKTIKKAKKYFEICNTTISIDYEGNNYALPMLDEQAFHEAFLNSLVHRDYSHDGMVSVNFTERRIVISNPGKFYGGVSSENIAFHEPRHRNKSLAKTLMDFQLVDRAGMGISRMGIRSLMYGRSFPSFMEKEDFIEVSMDAEFFRAGIFVITQRNPEAFGITELLLLNCLFEVGKIDIRDVEKRLKKIVSDPWDAIEDALSNKELLQYVRLIGTNDGILFSINDGFNGLFDCHGKIIKCSTNTSERHIRLYKFLKKHGKATNQEIMNLLKIKSSSNTSKFLKRTSYLTRKGKASSNTWIIVE